MQPGKTMQALLHMVESSSESYRAQNKTTWLGTFSATSAYSAWNENFDDIIITEIRLIQVLGQMACRSMRGLW